MVKPLKNQRSVYYTIDLEDFTFDYCRSLSTQSPPKRRKYCIYDSYENFKNLMKKTRQPICNITFFCTGVMADRYPDLIELIAKDGHEIACHGNFHDNIFDMSTKEISRSLNLAKEKLSTISNTDILGFRAPRFSVSEHDIPRLKAIADVFKYDSSLNFSTFSELKYFRSKLPFNLKEFPVPHASYITKRIMVKAGGSYLKLFPVSFVKRTLEKSIQNQLTPIVYLHPYDLYFGNQMMATWSELAGAKNRAYWYLRQRQWASAFNQFQEKKLESIFSEFQNLGRIDNLLVQ